MRLSALVPATLLCLLIPGMRDTERGEHLAVLAEEGS